MAWALIGIILGVILGFQVQYSIPMEYTKYTAVVLIGILDALFGAIRAETTKDQYSAVIFISGLIFNVLLAVIITFLGEKLGLDLYLAATVVFTFRIFSNVGITRRAMLQNFMDKRHKAKEQKQIE
ncbi:MAG: Small basic protein [Candidatus Peregrinibacteria bacterium GW2011_GWA2_38_36]|nr:MAG: Small basic protein [Candidatus Peregrinibacteria bacterium GW2011_GWA2_38_36]